MRAFRNSQNDAIGKTLVDGVETLVEVYTGPFEQASVIRGLLEAYGVPAFLRDSTFGIESPSYCEIIGGSRIFKLFVRHDDLETAKTIIAAPPEQNLAGEE